MTARKAIVTGGAGFIGSVLVARLEGAGWDVTVIDDYSTHDIPPVPRAGVIRRPVQQVQLIGFFDAVFHLAGKVGPTGVLRWAGRIVRDTVDAAGAAALWARQSGCPLIDVSTSEVYGDPTGPNSESTPRTFQPGHSARMEYAIGKLAAETMLLNTPELDVRIIRPFNVAGPGQRPDGGFVLPRFVQQALRGEALTVYAPGTQRRAFTHVEDIVDGILAAYERGQPGEAYNLGNAANECSIIELALEVGAAVGWGGWELVDPIKLHGPDFREAAEKIPDASKAYRELGWRSSRSRAQIIREVVDAYDGPSREFTDPAEAKRWLLSDEPVLA